MVNERPELKISRQAYQCINEIQSKLASLGTNYPAFKEISKAKIEVSPSPSGNVRCGFEFRYRVNYLQNGPGVQAVYRPVLEDDGVLLDVEITDHVWLKACITRIYEVKIGDKEIAAYYYLKIGKNVNESTITTVLDKQLSQFCEQVRQMK